MLDVSATVGMSRGPADESPVCSPHALSIEQVMARLDGSTEGLTQAEAESRLARYGPNRLPAGRARSLTIIFFGQFLSPLIYVLLAAAVLSAVIGEWSDAGFIAAVLLINAIVGTVQEFTAQRAATSLQTLVQTRARVIRDGNTLVIDADSLVPGDIILLESGDRIPADARLVFSHDLRVDESLLTGESVAITKDACLELPADTYLADRRNMAFAGTMVHHGRARGAVVATGLSSQLGQIAADVISRPPTKAPLLVRMERFTRRIALFVGIAAIVMAIVVFLQGTPLKEIFFLAVALSVSAIPEGLPVALTVALAIGMRRMAKRNVIIRRLVSVEGLGSCTFIATDKTGTLTMNQLTVVELALPDGTRWSVTGGSMDPDGTIEDRNGNLIASDHPLLHRLCAAAVLPNDGFLGRQAGEWVRSGDAVDVGLLVMARKIGIDRAGLLVRFPEVDDIPFESERLLSASLNRCGGSLVVQVKGAVERLLPLCSMMAAPDGKDGPLDADAIQARAQKLAEGGYRVLGLATGTAHLREDEVFSEEDLRDLTFLGMVCMIDPLRPRAREAVADCLKAGIEVAMITGDHPATALAIARDLGLADSPEQVVTGRELKAVEDTEEEARLIAGTRVFARVEPHQKLHIVHALQRLGHFVAVSGDGANDAPALRAAQIGVAMGRGGTDVARETAGMIIADDHFESIVAGVEEGRVAYANVRKVIFLLISTGAAELVLFALALLSGLPLPLLAVQLLWLNLVTNGIQDVALAFEPAEGDELSRPPRPPKEPIFNRIMIERVIVSAIVIGSVAYFTFGYLLDAGFSVEQARGGTLLLMVLFENIHVFNCRSETRSIFSHGFLNNPILLIGTAAAQGIHIGAMYTPWISDVLGIAPVTLDQWLTLLGLALSVMVAMEIHKFIRGHFASP